MKYIAYARDMASMPMVAQVSELLSFSTEHGIGYFKEKVYGENENAKASSTPVFQMLCELLEEDDTLIVASLASIGMTREQIVERLEWLRENKVHLVCMDIPISVEALKNATLLDIVARTVGETLESIIAASARKKGAESMYRTTVGRPKAIADNKFAKEYPRVLRGEIRPFELIKELGLTVSTYYRYKKEYELAHEMD